MDFRMVTKGGIFHLVLRYELVVILDTYRDHRTSNPVWGSEGCPRWVRFPCTSAIASNKTPVYIPGVFLAKPYSLTSFTQFWFDRK